MTDREQTVLAMLYEERVEELTPAYLAYRLRIASTQAAELLDSFVRSGTLELYFDAEGNISYGLPAAERERLARQPARNHTHHKQPAPFAQPANTPSTSHYDDPALEAHFFGTANPQSTNPQSNNPQSTSPQPAADYRTHSSAAPSYYPPADPNGYDGSIGSPADAPEFGYAQPPRAYQHHSPQHAPQYVYPQHQHHAGHYTTYPDTQYRHGAPQSHYTTPNGQMVRYNHAADQLIEVPRESNPSVAAFLSFLVVGGGQWYNGEYAKGAWMFIGCAVSWLFLMGWIVTFWSIIDAYAVAKERRSLPR